MLSFANFFPFALKYCDQGTCQLRNEAFLAEESFLLDIDWLLNSTCESILLMIIISPRSTLLSSRYVPVRIEAFLTEESFLLGIDWLYFSIRRCKASNY